MTSTVELETGRNKCMLKEALTYLSFGWSVMPLRPHSKEPLLGSWTEYQRRLPTVMEVTRWFTQSPDSNLAVLTGCQSHLGVVDVDGEIGFSTLLRLGLTSPVTSLTGKGRQLFFRLEAPLKNAVRTLPGIDIRGDGGYVVSPPSLHPNGKRYTWLHGACGVGALPMFPQTIFVSSATATLATSKAKPQGWLGEALNSLGAGNRNDTFASVVGKLHRDRWTPGDIRAVLLPHALRVQFPESELDTVIWSITRKPVLINGRGAQANSGIDQPNTEKQKLVLRTFANDYHEYDARKSGSRQMDYPTGYASFDRITTGLQRGELLIVGARTETGKTNLLLGIAHGLCTASKRVLLLSTEMSFDRIWDRYLALGEGTREHSLSVCDEFTPDLGRIRDALVESKADVFIFDHINIVGEDNQVISTFLKGLKELARELNMPGIVSAQLNRQAEWKDQEGNPVEPQLQHLKGSGAIEETAAQVLLLQVKEDADDAKYVQGYVRKNRYGEKGVVDFVLRKKPYRMVEL